MPTISGIETHHTIVGDGAAQVVMLHGWGAHSGLMLPLAEKLAPRGYTIYVPDLPGFGSTPPPPTAWTVYDYARFVLAYLDSLAAETRVHLVGHSFGGRLGLILGADHAARLDKLVLIDSAGVRPPLPASVRVRTAAFKAVRGGLRTLRLYSLADGLQAWYSGRYGSADYQALDGVMRETFVKVVNEDLLPFAARVQPSTLLLWGEHDTDTPVWQGELLEKTIPDAGLVVFKGAGHYSYLDHLADAVHIIDTFFQSPA